MNCSSLPLAWSLSHSIVVRDSTGKCLNVVGIGQDDCDKVVLIVTGLQLTTATLKIPREPVLLRGRHPYTSFSRNDEGANLAHTLWTFISQG